MFFPVFHCTILEFLCVLCSHVLFLYLLLLIQSILSDQESKSVSKDGKNPEDQQCG